MANDSHIFLRSENNRIIMRKGLSTSLEIAIAAIVILIVALVILTIFSGSIWPVGDFTAVQGICKSKGSSICSVTRSLPNDWNSKVNYRVGNNIEESTCAALVGCNSCQGCGFLPP